MGQLLKRFLFLVMVIAMAVQAQDEQINHPELRWYTYKTEHFQIHFHEGAERSARVVAQIAEDIYDPITTLYNHRPDGIIHFIIKDHDDNSNGAAFYYDNKVEIWAPQMTFILRGTHDWLRNVVTHEFSHMISLGAARKMPRKLPAFYLQMFGYEPEKREDVLYGYPNVIASYPIPMTVMPMWLAEGMAQFQTQGLNYDLWDSHRDMLIRSALMAGKALTYSEMGVFGKNSLGNERTYNAGYALTRYIVNQWGEATLNKLSANLAKPFSFTAESALREATGLSGEELYARWQQEMNAYYQQRLAVIDAHRVQGKIVTPKGIGNTFAVWSPDGSKLAYCGSESGDYLSLTHLWLLDVASGKKEMLKSGVNSQLSWSSDGRFLYYSRNKRGEHGSHYFDIYRLEVAKRQEKRLTTNLRSYDPDISRDGQNIVCVVQKDGTDNLMLLDGSGQNMRSLTAFTQGEAVSSPRFSPDGKQVVFSQARRHGRDLLLLDLETSRVDTLVSGSGDARDPFYAADGKQIYFAWDKTGIFNIYSIEADGRNLQLWTNVTGGAFMPGASQQGSLVYADFQYDGYKIASLDKPQPVAEEQAVYAPANNASRMGLEMVAVPAELQKMAGYDDAQLPALQAEPYEMTYGQVSFLPRVMMDYKTLKLGTYFYASDILERYSMFGGASLNSKMDLDAFAIFEVRRFKPTLFLELYAFTRHVDRDIEVIEDYPEKTRVGLGFNILEADLGAQFSPADGQTLRGAFVHSRYISKIDDFFFKGIKWVSPQNTYYIGNQFVVTWNLDQVARSSTSEINPRVGQKLDVRYSLEFNQFFKDYATDNSYGTPQEIYNHYNYNRLEMNWNLYLPAPWARQHALASHIHAGWIDRPVDDFFNFFAGGLPGLRGYPYYSIEGRKLLMGRFSYRLPILRSWQKRIFHVTGNHLYAGAFFDYGNAFNEDKVDLDQFKKDAGLTLRVQAFSFYGFPTALQLEAAYGMDRVENAGVRYGHEWRYYAMLLFDFIE